MRGEVIDSVPSTVLLQCPFIFAWVWLVVVVQRFDAEAGEEDRHQGANAEGKDNGACTDGAAHEPADDQDSDLDSDPGDTDIDTSSRQSRHQSIPWTGPKSGSDVETGSEGDDGGAAEHQYPSQPQGFDGFGQQPQRGIDDDADQDHVEDRSDTDPFLEGDPEQQHNNASQNSDSSYRYACVSRDALMHDFPRRKTKICDHHQCDSDTEQDQPNYESWDPPADL